MAFQVEQLNRMVHGRVGGKSLAKRQSLAIRRPSGIEVSKRTKGDAPSVY
jgi:hypothetical protein